jgi:hypothetical protein
MFTRCLLFLAAAGSAASLWAQGMVLGLAMLGGPVAPLSHQPFNIAEFEAEDGKAEGLPLDSPEAEACLASVRRFADLWHARDYEGVFGWLPASRQEALRKIAGAFFTQFDEELANETAGLVAEMGAALKDNADLIHRTLLEKWAENPDEISAEQIRRVGERLSALAAVSRADLKAGRVEPLLAQLGALTGALNEEVTNAEEMGLRQEVTRVRSSSADGSFSVETVLHLSGGGFAMTNATKAVLVDGVWVPAPLAEDWTPEATDRIISEKIPELMAEIAGERDKSLFELRAARVPVRRMAAATTVEEMDAAGRAFVAAMFSFGEDDGDAAEGEEADCGVLPEIPDQP